VAGEAPVAHEVIGGRRRPRGQGLPARRRPRRDTAACPRLLKEKRSTASPQRWNFASRRRVDRGVSEEARTPPPVAAARQEDDMFDFRWDFSSTAEYAIGALLVAAIVVAIFA